MSKSESVPGEAKSLHDAMRSNGKEAYSQDELSQLLPSSDPESLMNHIQSLIDFGLIKLLETKDKQLLFQPISASDAAKISNMSNDEAMIYSYIEASGREGIWTKTIKAKTNLHQHVVLRCLKSLESQSYIKSIKSVKHPQRKIYMLYHLTPSIEVTGGPWFTDSELDTEFINSLLVVIWRFVASKSYPKAFKKDGFPNGVKQYSYNSDHKLELPNLQDISEFIVKSGVTPVELSLSDIKSLCDVLEYDEKLESISEEFYKAPWQSILEAGGGKISGEDIYGPQNDEIFNISDNYRVMEAQVNEEDGEQNEPVYLDSWITI